MKMVIQTRGSDGDGIEGGEGRRYTGEADASIAPSFALRLRKLSNKAFLCIIGLRRAYEQKEIR